MQLSILGAHREWELGGSTRRALVKSQSTANLSVKIDLSSVIFTLGKLFLASSYIQKGLHNGSYAYLEGVLCALFCSSFVLSFLCASQDYIGAGGTDGTTDARRRHGRDPHAVGLWI